MRRFDVQQEKLVNSFSSIDEDEFTSFINTIIKDKREKIKQKTDELIREATT